MMNRIVSLVVINTVLILWSNVVFAQGNFWEQADGPDGGSIYSFCVSNSGIVFAGTAGSGLFRSTDNCETWEAVDMGTPINNVTALATAPNGDLYAATEYVFGTTLTIAVYRSTDEGLTWTWASNGLSAVYLQSIVVNSTGYVFVGSDGGGVFRSTNDGLSWTRVYGDPNTPEAHVSSLIVNSDGHIFVASWLGVARSTDDGNTWQQLNLGLSEPYVRSLSVSPTGHIFGAAWSEGIIRSTNNGDTWSLVYSGVNDHTVFVAPNGYVFFAEEWNTGGTVRRSTDNGSTWSVVLDLPPSGQFQIRAFSALSDGTILMSYSEDGVRLSTDNGTTWQRKNNGLRALSIQNFLLDQSGYVIAGTFGAGIFRSANGIDWQQSNQGLSVPYIWSIAAQSNGTIFIGTKDDGIFKSTDSGENWVSVRNDIDGTAIAIDETDAIFAGEYGSIYRSVDNGLTWVRKDSGVISSFIQCMAINPTNGYIFVGTGNGMNRTTNKGESWDTLSLGWDVRSIAINSLGHIFVAVAWGGGFFRSTDNGDSWASINNGITSFGTAIYCHPSGDVYASSLGGGAYLSTDNGNSWNQVNSGLTANTIFAFSLDNSGHLLAGTWANGVFRSVETTVSIADDSDQIPLKIALHQNYPNPFNSTTRIAYELPRSSYVTLSIYDLLGRSVQTLVSEFQTTGIHSINFNSSHVSSGVYLYQLKVNNQVIETKKMILIR